MRRGRTISPALFLAAVLIAGCASAGSRQAGSAPPAPRTTTASAASPAPAAVRPRPPPHPRPRAGPVVQALVTAETENRVLVVDLPSGRVVRSIALPPDPEDIAAPPAGGDVVVSSAASGKVTVLDRRSLRVLKVFGGFQAPHIVALSPEGRHAYVTDDTAGTLTVLNLATLRRTSTIQVGANAHHVGFDALLHQAWVALGQSATTIVLLDTRSLDHPRVIGQFDPGFPVHDVEFAPGGRQVWITSSGGPEVSVLGPANRRLLFQVAVGAPPQHVAFAGRYAYLTSGYGSAIEQVDAATGRILARAAAPYGSFELAAADGYVATSSLLRGTLAIYTPRLKLVRTVQLAPVAREVAISSPA
jgi:YVTN family beta-propeller protein